MIRHILGKPTALAEISRDIAQVLFASAFVDQMLNKEWRVGIIISGVSLSIIFWLTNLLLSKK
jgi:hypothetical protein